MNDYEGDPISFAEDFGKSALRLAIVLACLIGAALFSAGVLTGMVISCGT